MYVYIYASCKKNSLCATVQQVQTDCDMGIHDRVSIIRMVIPKCCPVLSMQTAISLLFDFEQTVLSGHLYVKERSER